VASWTVRALVVIFTTSLAVAVGAIVGRFTCTEPGADENGLLSGLDLWEIDCLQYHVLPGAAVGLLVGLVAGVALALRNLPE
jgi:hypothetical protein